MAHNTGTAQCSHCGAKYRLVTEHNRDMQRLCKAWLSRHERPCATRTPEQRRAWAQKYVEKTFTESSLTVDLDHAGFRTLSCNHADEISDAYRPGQQTKINTW